MRTGSSADATSDFAVRESYAAGIKTIPRMTPHLRSLGDSFCGDGELHLYSALGGSVSIVASFLVGQTARIGWQGNAVFAR